MTGQPPFAPSRLKAIIRLVVVGQALLLLSLLADMTEIISSNWFKALLSYDVLRWFSYVLNILLTSAIIYIFRGATKQESFFRAELEKAQARSIQLEARDINLWKRFIRTLRSITLEDLPKPHQRDALEPLLDELAKRLPNNGAYCKLAIAKPQADGKFSILAERGMDPSSVFALEQWANWKERRSFFGAILGLSDDIKYATFLRGAANYLDIQKPEGIESRPSSSGSHFIVAIREANYYQRMPKNTIALVSVGIPRGQELNEKEQEELFQTIFPIIKGIEGVLLCYSCAERKVTVTE